MDIKGKVALVTGGGTGVGRAVALQLAKLGAAVAVNYSKSESEAKQTAKDVTDCGVQSRIVQADVADESQVQRMIETVRRQLGPIEILVNNAAFTRFTNLADLNALSQQDWNRTFAVNVNGTFYCSRAAAPMMKSQGFGRIVNVSSIAAFTGRGSSIAYCASKAAVLSLTRSLAKALGPEITVNAVAPGLIETRWIEGIPGMEEFRDTWIKQTALHKVLTPDDVAEVAVSLITSMSQVTGQTMIVDAGMM
ncbi:MAG: SDR family oxidoreductase [Acidobacteria bacterium]|nr:SDR family oxidoreductase [Acidobacteriota bacterium]MBV9144870.1 SDR family oxidoreductase [Acidobacteriota bacterium]MBV9434479.1 SDR family oxidoreductase [Acidobacteriota bacterium]